jgi:hypothetical protein
MHDTYVRNTEANKIYGYSVVDHTFTRVHVISNLGDGGEERR